MPIRFLLPVFLLFLSCQHPAPPVSIIFDTDMGSDCDDAGALALLHAYADQGQAEILACVYTSGRVPYGAGVVQAINIACGRPDIPVGAYHNTNVGDPVDKMQAEKLARDTTAFGNRIIHNHDAPLHTQVLRQLLAAQPDTSVTYLTVGHTKGLYDLLVSQPDSLSPLNGTDLVNAKVKHWVALGALRADNPDGWFVKDWNFCFNGTAPYTEYLVEHFPRPVVYISAGHDVLTGQPLQHTPPGRIVRTVYRDWLWNVENKTLDDGRPSWDLAAVYYAVKGTGDYLENQGHGVLEFDAENGSRWHPDPEHRQQTYITQKPDISGKFADYLNNLIAAQ